MTTELQKIAQRIRDRESAQQVDRSRQRELIRERISTGSTWDAVQAEASVSRPTIMGALKRSD